MHFFQYARDYYGGWLPEQLLWGAGLLLLLLVVLFMGIHLLRRSAGQPVATESGPEDKLSGGQARKYERNARLYHWGNALFILALAVSGLALFTPGALRPLRVSWLLVHEVAAALFSLGLLVHIVVAPRHGRGRYMWFERRDWHDLKLIAGNFFGRTRAYPAIGKYDPWQKLYHAFLTLLSVALLFSGVFLLLSAAVWVTFSHSWLRWQRLLHDVGAFAFIAIVLGHVYFGVIRINWPNLGAMLSGRIPAAFFNRFHSIRRWRPPEQDTGETDVHP
jgi:cytochrome b subunit of formate dehydrogenase